MNILILQSSSTTSTNLKLILLCTFFFIQTLFHVHSIHFFSQVMFTQNILNLKIISLFVFQRKPLKIPTIFLFAAEKISFHMDKDSCAINNGLKIKRNEYYLDR